MVRTHKEQIITRRLIIKYADLMNEYLIKYKISFKPLIALSQNLFLY